MNVVRVNLWLKTRTIGQMMRMNRTVSMPNKDSEGGIIAKKSPRVAAGGGVVSPRVSPRAPAAGSLPLMSPQQRSTTMQSTQSAPQFALTDDPSETAERSSGADDGKPPVPPVPPVSLDFVDTQRPFMSTWNELDTERTPTAKRPGRDLPDHWPTSDTSRESSHARTKLLTTQNALGVGPEARRKEKMRRLRVKRKREQDIETYHAAFAMIDIDHSGKVDPMEIVAFVETMGKKINTVKFWKLFNDLDLDNSADLDMEEFIKVMDELTRQSMMVATAKKASAKTLSRGAEDSASRRADGLTLM